MKMVEIVKVQIPLAPTKSAMPMIYDKLRKRVVSQPLDDASRQSMGHDIKGFFEAEWNPKSKQWKLGQRVASQLW